MSIRADAILEYAKILVKTRRLGIPTANYLTCQLPHFLEYAKNLEKRTLLGSPAANYPTQALQGMSRRADAILEYAKILEKTRRFGTPTANYITCQLANLRIPQLPNFPTCLFPSVARDVETGGGHSGICENPRENGTS